ncbi:large ribosomal subunit protein uL22m-like [Antedon mediterranea]|uniref:large ribosomal subunit protein uL22m-like n=1 Tax=Antedon mediterranea TaxID=105859 RepID=UPI003AF7A47B
MNVIKKTAFTSWTQRAIAMIQPTSKQIHQNLHNYRPTQQICCFCHRYPSIANISRQIHTSTTQAAGNWEKNNNIKYPPQLPGEPPRMAEVYHCRRQIKYSKEKLWYIATFIKGRMIDDALTQLDHINMKGAKIVKEILLEAQDMAVKDHNVEFRSNLHISRAISSKGEHDKAIRIHAKGRYGIMNINYNHFYVCLKEGPPPKQEVVTGYDQAREYIENQRKRTIIRGL